MKKAFFFLFLIALLVLGLAVAYYFLWPRNGGEAHLELAAPGITRAGEPFTLDAFYSNDGSQPVRNAKLTIALPEGVLVVGQSPDVRFFEHELGELGAGVSEKQSVTLIAASGVQTVKRLDGRLSYNTGTNEKVQFEAKAVADVEIGQPAIALNFTTPEKIFSGQSFSMTVKYENISDFDFPNVRLKLDYPVAFMFEKADPAPAQGKNMWNLGEVKRKGQGTIVLTGTVTGGAASVANVRGTLGVEAGSRFYDTMVQEAALELSVSPLSLAITVNGGGAERVLRIGENVSYALTYKNNSPVSLENVNIRAQPVGALFNFAQAKSSAFFNSITNTFLWNPANVPALARLAPGEQGSVVVDIKLLETFPIIDVNDKNFTITLDGEVESATVPDRTGALRTFSAAHIENRVAGVVTLSSRGYFRDPASGVNTGPFPPKVNQPTQYTVHWVLKNYGTDMKDVRVSAFLQSNTRFVKAVKNTLGSAPKVNTASGEVTWEIANLPATRGVVGEPVEAIFQVENTPAVNQVGQAIHFLGETRLSAEDVFTGLAVQTKTDGIQTDLLADKAPGDTGKVVP